ncbi:MAG TPA: FAD-dependent oxidoreductase [Thermoanaerobaculia bacterium]|jgi:selenide,water dikinase|nr:FAD-dependent oxidoreductase [Thermoanaerobaculia bacterium]
MTVLRLRPGTVRLLLVGAGHAHLEILRRLALEPLGVTLTVVSWAPRHHYSGMVPGYLQGTYTEEQISVDVPRLVGRAGGRFLAGIAVAVDPARQTVRLASGEELTYDLVSFAVGSNTAGADAPEIAAHALSIKPLARVAALRERLLGLAREDGERRVAIVGGGAAGVEVAFACARVLDTAGGIGGRGPRRLTIVESGPEILAGYTGRFRALARRLLAERGIEILTGRRARAVHPREVELEGLHGGNEVPSDLTIWLTGAVAFPLFRGSGLPLDGRGFLLLDDALRSLADPRIFAVGDCGTLAHYPDTPKAGVYAVREAPILWASLKATLDGVQPPSYRPQAGFLSLLNTADERALLEYKGQVAHGRWAFWWKDWLDRRFLARYQR